MVIEGEPGGAPPAPAVAERTASDTIQERKHHERLERLAAMNEVRLQESSARKSSMAAAVDPRESVDLFLSSFSQNREAVEVGLALARTTKEIQPSSMKEHLEKLSTDVTAMAKSVADAYFLPASIVKASQNTVLKLRDELEVANAELVPRKKFSFRNKAKKPLESLPSPHRATGELIIPMASSVMRGEEETQKFSGTDSVLNGEDGAKKSSVQAIEANAGDRIVGKSNSIFVRDAEELGGELTLSNLTNCKVYLRGRLTNLVVHTLKDCHIYSGPVTGSVFIENVKSSVLVLASHQIRIHSTSCTDFYLRVRSKPIVEYTSENRFAPYAFAYEGIQEDLQAANLAEETGLWEKVDDFRWLRAVHSPNWSVLPVEERVPVEDGFNVVGLGLGE